MLSRALDVSLLLAVRIYIFMYKIHILKKERRFGREWLVINHSVSLDVTLSPRRKPSLSESRAYLASSPGSFARARLERDLPKTSLYARTVFQRLVRLAVDASRTGRKRKQEGGRCSKASRGRRPVRKRPSSLKYVPAGGNYAFNYLNEWPGIQRDFPLYLSLPSPLLFFLLLPVRFHLWLNSPLRS